MELRRYLHLLRQRLVLVILSVVAGVAGGYLATNHTRTYQATTSIYVGSRDPSALQSNDIIQMDRIIATYAAMVKSTPVAEGAVQASHAPRSPGQVAGETTAAVVTNTNLISITVTDLDPSVAESLANGVAASFIAQVQNLVAASGPAAATAPSVSVFQPAGLPGASLATSVKRNLALGALFGLVVSIGAVLLIDYLDISIKNAEDLEAHSALPVLGTIPYRRARPSDVQPMAR
jgi:polysaccharide biosynthesis transport protein